MKGVAGCGPGLSGSEAISLPAPAQLLIQSLKKVALRRVRHRNSMVDITPQRRANTYGAEAVGTCGINSQDGRWRPVWTLQHRKTFIPFPLGPITAEVMS